MIRATVRPPYTKYGIVGANSGLISAANVPFGGVKESGYGREGGPEGLEGYMVTKRVSHKLSLDVPSGGFGGVAPRRAGP